MRNRAWAGIALVMAAGVLTPALLFAHAQLKRSTPAANAVVTSLPTAIGLWFTENPVLSATAVELVDPDGRAKPLVHLRADSADRSGVIADVPDTLRPGTYTVRWKTAADDGHASSGSFTFTVRVGARPAEAPVPAAAPPPRAAGPDTGQSLAAEAERWVEFMAIVTLLGVLAFHHLVLPRAAALGTPLRETAGPAQRLGASAAAVLILAMLARAHAQAATFGLSLGRGALSLPFALFATRWGHGWIVGCAGTVIAALALRAVREDDADDTDLAWLIAAGGAVGISFYPALTGHAAAAQAGRVPAVVIDAIHVAAAGAWIGTLFVATAIGVPVALRRPEAARPGSVSALVRAFHPVALISAATMAATGSLSGWMRVQSLGAFWTSPYGRVLLIKAGVFLLVLVLGALNWRVITPRLASPDGPRALRRSMALELTLGALVLALTAMLVSTPTPEPPATTPSASSASGSP